MTISNGNGKSRTNGNGKKSGGLVETPTLENLPTVDELLAPPNQQNHQDEQPKTQTEQQSAEDLLRQAKQQTRTKAEPAPQVAPEPQPEPEQGGELATATEQIGSAIVQAGQNLVDAQELAQQQLIATGAEQARNDARVIAQAYQAVLLEELSEHTAANARSIREQLGLLRQHIDGQNGGAVQSTLQNLGITIKQKQEDTNPLGEVVKAKKEVKGIQLFPKK